MVRFRPPPAADSPQRFDRFVLDRREARLLDGSKRVPLTPKAFALLELLLERSGSLVTKAELLDRVWAGVHVGDSVLKECIRELRRALGDDASRPRFIETVHRRGYRFLVGPTTGDERDGESSGPPLIAWPPVDVAAVDRPSTIVGRESELQRLERSLADAFGGERRFVFVSGEAGIGKSRLVEAFLFRAARESSFWACGGQSIEAHGPIEPYRPVLDALGRLCRSDAHDTVVPLVRRIAPSWLTQMPWLLEAADRRELEREVAGSTRDRMLREVVELFEGFARVNPFVLVLEDLHWCDAATVDLLVWLAERREPSRLLVIGTYRPAELVTSGHPLGRARLELRRRGRSEEIALDFLGEGDVARYLALAYPERPPPAGLAHFLHRQTDGNPLFMKAAIEELLSRGCLDVSGGRLDLREPLDRLSAVVPESLRDMIDGQVDRLTLDDQRLLEAASVSGPEFSSASVAAALEAPLADVEAALERFCRRRQSIESAARREEWPDGTVTGAYRFVHQLHQSVVYGRVAPVRRRTLHRRIADRIASAFGDDAGAAVTELAVHFERAGDPDRSAAYAELAAKRAIRRHANREAIGLISRALDQLRPLPETEERIERRLSLEMRLGQASMAVEGYGAPAVENAYARARELCGRIGDAPGLFGASLGLWGYYVVRASLATAETLAGEALRLASAAALPPMLVGAHHALGVTKLYQGAFASARDHLDEAVALYDSQRRQSYGVGSVQDPKASALSNGAWARWFLGDVDGALERARQATAFARSLDHPFSLLFALDVDSTIAQCLGDAASAARSADELVERATEHGFPVWLATGTITRGWVRAKAGEGSSAIEDMKRGIAQLRDAGVVLAGTFYLALLAERLIDCGRVDEALVSVDEGLALAEATGERFFLAELWRLRGEILGTRECLIEAAEIARSQGAVSLTRRVEGSRGVVDAPRPRRRGS